MTIGAQKAILFSIGTGAAIDVIQKQNEAEAIQDEVGKIAAYSAEDLAAAAEYETKTITEYRAQVIADNAEITAAIEEIDQSKLTAEEKENALRFIPPLETVPTIPIYKDDAEWQAAKIAGLEVEKTTKEIEAAAIIDSDTELKKVIDNLEPKEIIASK